VSARYLSISITTLFTAVVQVVGVCRLAESCAKKLLLGWAEVGDSRSDVTAAVDDGDSEVERTLAVRCRFSKSVNVDSNATSSTQSNLNIGWTNAASWHFGSFNVSLNRLSIPVITAFANGLQIAIK